jgi:hypothetical protein
MKPVNFLGSRLFGLGIHHLILCGQYLYGFIPVGCRNDNEKKSRYNKKNKPEVFFSGQEMIVDVGFHKSA